MTFKGEVDDPIFMLTLVGYYRAMLEMLSLLAPDFSSSPRDERFSSIVSIVAWCMWKNSRERETSNAEHNRRERECAQVTGAHILQKNIYYKGAGGSL